MTESRGVQSLGWTRRTAAVSVLLVMDEHRKQAGDRLARLRDARGLSQEELAHLAGISVKTISRFENGRHDGRRGTVRALAKALDVNEHDIIGEPPAPLGMGETQLDQVQRGMEELVARVAALEVDLRDSRRAERRIEKRLGELLSRLPAEGLAEALEAEAARVRAQREQNDEESKRNRRSDEAS